MKVVFITPYPKGLAPSQRFRFEQYFQRLTTDGIEIHQYSFLSEKAYLRLYQSGYFSKLWWVIYGFLKRMAHLFLVIPADLVFIHREASPVGPPWFEFIVGKLMGKKMVYDFDDAIWIKYDGRKTRGRLVTRSKIGKICAWSTTVSVGNEYLREYAFNYNSRVIVNPTVIDPEYHSFSKGSASEPPVLGWTGSHTTARYMEEWLPGLDDLQREFAFRFIFISNKPPTVNYPWLDFMEWNRETEIDDLKQIDIGLMPLPEDPWVLGKCGFKLIQYMATGIIAVGTPVGINRDIIEDGINGYYLSLEGLGSLLLSLKSNPGKIREIKEAARKTIQEKFSVDSGYPLFFETLGNRSVFEEKDK